MTVRPRRSALYMPGSNARALEKARTIPADVLILDLEDSVAPDAKTAARDQVAAAVAAGGYENREIVIRINGLGTSWGEADLAMAGRAAPDAVLIPKIDGREGIERVATALAEVGAKDGVRIWAMMETPLAVLNAREIAGCAGQPGNRLACLVMGLNDLIKDMRAADMPGRAPALYAMSACITAARAYGLDVLDGVHNDIRDTEGCRVECLHGRQLGFDGKTLIHPNQVAAANEAFAPSASELAWARKISAAFALPENSGRGVITVDGRMVERLHLAMAKRVIAIAEAIGVPPPS